MRAVISGYYGFGNAGDEAVLAGIVQSVRSQCATPPSDLTVLSANPAQTERLHGVRAVHRMKASLIRRALRESDMLISGGGSLLQDATSFRSVLYYLWVIRSACRLGKPVMVYAQGIGPLRNPLARRLSGWVLSGVQAITVRDPSSADVLRDLGVFDPAVEVTADPAMALAPPAIEEGRQALKDLGLDLSRPVVGVSARSWSGMVPAQALAELIGRLHERDMQVVLLEFQRSVDGLVLREAQRLSGDKAVVMESDDGYRRALATVRGLTALIGMRLHALVFGLLGVVPMIGIPYDPKVEAFLRRIGQDDRLVDVDPFDAASAADAAFRVCAERDEIVESLDHGRTRLSILARRNAEIAMAVCQK